MNEVILRPKGWHIKCLLRFFSDKNNQIPNNSEELKITQFQVDGESHLDIELDDQISDWLIKHPNGKIDIIKKLGYDCY